MKLKYRFYILFSAYTWATIGLFLTGSLWFYLLPLMSFVYLFIGGRKHV